MFHENKHIGCLLGLAMGDALGTTLEFRKPGTFEPITDIVGGGPFRLEPGEWTDDTSMALCMADSLIETEGEFDPGDIMRRFVQWWKHGHNSVLDHCFDIGNTTRGALSRYEEGLTPYVGSTDPNAAGNGSLMRLAPVPMIYAFDPETAIEAAMLSSQLTHAATTCVDSCRYYAGLIVGALTGVPKDELLSEGFAPTGKWEGLHPEIEVVANGSFKERNPPEIRGTGYVVDALEAALWAFYNSTSFVEGALLAVNLGDDADTTGAIYGMLAGAHYGLAGIPNAWVRKIAWREKIKTRALSLLDICRRLDSEGFDEQAPAS